MAIHIWGLDLFYGLSVFCKGVVVVVVVVFFLINEFVIYG